MSRMEIVPLIAENALVPSTTRVKYKFIKTTFIKNQFHQKTSFIKDQFHQKPLSSPFSSETNSCQIVWLHGLQKGGWGLKDAGQKAGGENGRAWGKNETKGWDSQYSPCLCEGVAGRRPATPSHKHGLCPRFGFQQAFAGDDQHEGLLKVERRGFRV